MFFTVAHIITKKSKRLWRNGAVDSGWIGENIVVSILLFVLKGTYICCPIKLKLKEILVCVHESSPLKKKLIISSLSEIKIFQVAYSIM